MADEAPTPKEKKKLRSKLNRYIKKYGMIDFTFNDVHSFGTIEGMMERFFTSSKMISADNKYYLKAKLHFLTLKAQKVVDLLPGIVKKEVSQKMTYGLVHAAVQLGPYRFDWTPDSLSYPKPLFSNAVPIMMLDLPNGLLYEGDEWGPVANICRKICSVLVEWNRKKEYGMKNHCQKFVHELLSTLEILPNLGSSYSPSSTSPGFSSGSISSSSSVSSNLEGDEPWLPVTSNAYSLEDCFEEPISSFLKHLHEKGTTSMRYKSPFGEKSDEDSDGEDSEVFIFTTHEELDEYVRLLLKKYPTFEDFYPSHWQLLKAFDRAFWAASMELKEKEELRKTEEEVRQKEETLRDLRQLREDLEKKEKQNIERERKFKLWREEIDRQAKGSLEDLHRLREELDIKQTTTTTTTTTNTTDNKEFRNQEKRIISKGSGLLKRLFRAKASEFEQDSDDDVLNINRPTKTVDKYSTLPALTGSFLKQQRENNIIDHTDNDDTNVNNNVTKKYLLKNSLRKKLRRSISDSQLSKRGDDQTVIPKSKIVNDKQKSENIVKSSNEKSKTDPLHESKQSKIINTIQKPFNVSKMKMKKSGILNSSPSLQFSNKSIPEKNVKERREKRRSVLLLYKRKKHSWDYQDSVLEGSSSTNETKQSGEGIGDMIGDNEEKYFEMKIDPKTVYVTCPFGSPVDLNGSFACIITLKDVEGDL